MDGVTHSMASMFEVLRAEAQKCEPPRYATSQHELRCLVERFSRPRHFLAETAENYRVSEELVTIFQGWGYHVSLQGEYRNVVARPSGLTGGDVTLIGAHYDSVPATPGADDNASAVAALLVCARQLASRQPPPRAVFVAFNREEDGMLGSTEFVKLLEEQPFQVSRAHILEMLGFTSVHRGSQRQPPLPISLPDVGDFLAIAGDNQSGIEEIVDRARVATPDLPVVALRLPRLMGLSLPVLNRSDHAPFWTAGHCATLWTDTAEFRNDHYHQSTDKPDTLDYGFLQRVTELLLAAVS